MHTRAAELRFMLAWFADRPVPPSARQAILDHLDAAELAALSPSGLRGWLWRRMQAPAVERAFGHLDAAEVSLLRVAPDTYVVGHLPSLLAQARSHLSKDDPRLQRMVRLAEHYQGSGSILPSPGGAPSPAPAPRWRQRRNDKVKLRDVDRDAIIAAFRAGTIEARREVSRARSFRNILYAATVGLTIGAVALGVVGIVDKTAVPLCFAPDNTAVCPLKSQAGTFSTVEGQGPGAVSKRDEVGITAAFHEATSRWDILIVELLGLAAAAVAGAATLRRLRGTSTPYDVPMAAAALKLPTGALTAVLGLLLMRGGFVPGLSDLDNSAQILAWAVVFGYAQQLFTRMVDTRAQGVMDAIGTPDQSKAPEAGVRDDAVNAL